MLVATVAGILGAGAVALSTVRLTGVCWVVIHVVGATPVLLGMGRTAFDVLLTQLVVYGGVLVAGVVYLANSFEQWSMAEINARRAVQFVEILLDDFEDGSRDWLWETDSTGLLTRASERLAEVSGHSLDQLRSLGMVELLRRVAHPSEPGQQSAGTAGRRDGQGPGHPRPPAPRAGGGGGALVVDLRQAEEGR